jgi:hypothetical protein
VFPVALSNLQASIVQGSGPPVCQIVATGSSASCTFTASANGNQLALIAAQAGSGAGLYSVKVVNSSSGAIAFAATSPLGTLPEPIDINLPAVDNYTVNSVDLQIPAALADFKLALVQGAELLIKQTATGNGAFSANAGTARLYIAASASSSSAGLYSVAINRGATVVTSLVDTVTDTVSAGTEGYVFTKTLPAAGNYSLQLRDFAIPATLLNLSANVSQGGVTLGSLSAAGTLSINAAAGDVTIAVVAKPDAAVSAGLFGIALTPIGSTTPLLEKTQGVGGIISQDFNVSAAAHFSVTATDFAAPVALGQQLRVAVTRGATSVGSIIGGGTFGFDTTPGTYTVNVISTAQSTPGYGMYGISVATAPVVNLTAAGNVSSGSSTTLTWDATDASSCLASGGWSGNKAVSGSATVGPLTGNTTFTLTCTGVGGSGTKSTTIEIQAAASSGSGGGGGAESVWLMLGYGLLAGARRLRARV